MTKASLHTISRTASLLRKYRGPVKGPRVPLCMLLMGLMELDKNTTGRISP